MHYMFSFFYNELEYISTKCNPTKGFDFGDRVRTRDILSHAPFDFGTILIKWICDNKKHF